jgi:transposase
MPKIEDDCIIGFLDESSPQTTANTQKMLSFTKPEICKNTSKFRANAFGFYALNGTSVIDFKQNSKKETVCEFLTEVRSENPDRPIIAFLDRFSSHRALETLECAERLKIIPVFLPPYSPDLNPIEYIWKSIKRIISCSFIRDIDHIKSLIADLFREYSSSLSYAKSWIATFLQPIGLLN